MIVTVSFTHRGKWIDRVSQSGELVPIRPEIPKNVLSSAMAMAIQFPLM